MTDPGGRCPGLALPGGRKARAELAVFTVIAVVVVPAVTVGVIVANGAGLNRHSLRGAGADVAATLATAVLEVVALVACGPARRALARLRDWCEPGAVNGAGPPAGAGDRG